MPRIPVRVEPYNSPSRQHRHYKNKRDQVLRALGKAAYINGSHFAIMWVSARGDVETYASEALQSRLGTWFTKGGIADEARELVMGSAGQPRTNPFLNDNSKKPDLSDDEGEGGDESIAFKASPSSQQSATATPNIGADDPFIERPAFSHNDVAMQAAAQTRADFEGRRFARLPEGKASGHRRPIAPLDTNVANEHYARSRELAAQRSKGAIGSQGVAGYGLGAFGDCSQPPHSAPLPGTQPSQGESSSGRAQTPVSARAPFNRSASSSSAQHPVQFANEAARTAFLELRFGQLQQGMCKTVAKAWIKIIEPKKQTRCPYNKGEEGKPAWWPAGVRHKEPDHLMKPERHLLLLTILRSPKVQVARLQLATAEVVALIRADKVSLLMDVYRVAREEEKMREANLPVDTPVTVSVSTLDGWSDVDGAPITEGLQSVRSMSPHEGSESSKKRSFSQAMARSASASALGNKRRAEGDDESTRRASGSGTSSWLMQEAAHKSMRKQQAVYGASYDELHGLATPLTGNTQMIDPQFMGAAEGGDHFAYSMSAQSGQNGLYQTFMEFDHHGHPAPGQQRPNQDALFSFATPSSESDHMNMLPGGVHSTPPSTADRSNAGDMSSGALGLHGVNMSASEASLHAGWTTGFEQGAFVAQFDNTSAQLGTVDLPNFDFSRQSQHAGPSGSSEEQIEMHRRSSMFEMNSANNSGSTVGDASFASTAGFETLNSSGPRTPSPQQSHAGALRLAGQRGSPKEADADHLSAAANEMFPNQSNSFDAWVRRHNTTASDFGMQQ